MAEKKDAKSKTKKCIVIPRNPDTANELYAFVNTGERPGGGLKIPFERPVYLTEKEIAALERQREAIQVDRQINVREIMDRHQVPQSVANKMAKASSQDSSMGGKQIRFVSKYIVSSA
jgi:hypothetical protein